MWRDPVVLQRVALASHALLVAATALGALVFVAVALAAAVVVTSPHRLWQLALSLVAALVLPWWPLQLAVCVAGLALALLLPVPRVRRSLAVPVGRSSHTIEDPTRTNERFDPTDTRTRRVCVSTWFPCEPQSNGRTAELFDGFDVVGAALVKILPAVPSWLRFFTMHINGPSSALANATPVADAKPLVVLLHGLTGPRWQYVSLAELLAENGFVVAAVEHPFDTACCLSYPPGQKQPTYALGRPPIDRPAQSPAEWERWHGHLRERVLDTHRVLLPWLRGGDSGMHIDWRQRVALVGHSFGAAEAVELMHQDSALYGPAVLHDPWLYPCTLALRTGNKALRGDFLSIASQDWQWKRNLKRIEVMHSSPHLEPGAKRFRLVLRGGRHHNFHDLGLIAPLLGQHLGMLGATLDPVRAVHVINETTLAMLRVCGGHGSEADWQACQGQRFPEVFSVDSVSEEYDVEYLREEQ